MWSAISSCPRTSFVNQFFFFSYPRGVQKCCEELTYMYGQWKVLDSFHGRQKYEYLLNGSLPTETPIWNLPVCYKYPDSIIKSNVYGDAKLYFKKRAQYKKSNVNVLSCFKQLALWLRNLVKTTLVRTGI